MRHAVLHEIHVFHTICYQVPQLLICGVNNFASCAERCLGIILQLLESHSCRTQCTYSLCCIAQTAAQDHTCLVCISLKDLNIVVHLAGKSLSFRLWLVWFAITDAASDSSSTYQQLLFCQCLHRFLVRVNPPPCSCTDPLLPDWSTQETVQQHCRTARKNEQPCTFRTRGVPPVTNIFESRCRGSVSSGYCRLLPTNNLSYCASVLNLFVASLQLASLPDLTVAGQGTE